MASPRPRPILYCIVGAAYGSIALFAHEASCVVPKLCAATYTGGALAVILAILGYHLGQRELALLEVTIRDPLTGLHNRRFFDTRLEVELARQRRHGVPLTLAMIDVDNMKTINTNGGHPGGDAALRRVAEVMRQSTRASDDCFRIGGDEFALLLPHTTIEEARLLSERLRAAFAGDLPSARMGLSVSLGLAQANHTHPTGADLVSAADRALFVAKSSGRNRVDVAAGVTAEPAKLTTSA